ncbi:MAG: hypothetical protein ACFFAH_12555 [Promethearchaeota archaeon]
MKDIQNWFEKIKKSMDPEEINDFLIEISIDPHFEYIFFINYFIENSTPEIHEHIKINLIFNLGILGQLEKVDNKFIDYLIKEYYNSDRWIRNEIILAFDKISTNINLSEEIIELVGRALNEEYKPIKLNTLKLLYNIENIPKVALKNLIQVLNISNSKIEELSISVLQKSIKDLNDLFNLLNFSETYKILNKKAIRSLLLIYVNSIKRLETLRELIKKSNFDRESKEKFLNEINSYEYLLLKKPSF